MAQCSNPTQVPNGTYTSGDHSQVASGALSAASVNLSGGASATYVAGACIQLVPSFRANAVGATAPTTFHAWVDTSPAAVSVSPASGTGLDGTFTWTVSSPLGHGNISHVFALFNTGSGSTTNACYIHYDPGSNLLYLADNASANWLGGFVPGSADSTSNSQCGISGNGASVSASGTQLSLTVPVTFQPSFSGTRNEYLFALDSSGLYTGWQQMGTWTVSTEETDYNLTSLQVCLNNTNTTVCTLSPGTYTVNTTININRYGVTLSGGTTNPQQTRLARGGSMTGPLVDVSVMDGNYNTVTMSSAQASKGILIQYLTVCGGGNINAPIGASPHHAVVSPPNSPCGDRHLSTGACPYGLGECTDISVSSAAVDRVPGSGSWPVLTTSYSYNGPYAVEFSHVDLEDAPGHALTITGRAPAGPFGSRYVNDVYFHDGSVNYSAVTGILTSTEFVQYTDSYCDKFQENTGRAFADDPSLFAPRNIRIEHNQFLYNNTSSVEGGSIRWGVLRNNNFLSNYLSPQDGNNGGGGIGFGSCADQVEVSGNTIIGPSGFASAKINFGGATTVTLPADYTATFAQTYALEYYGRNITVENNTVAGHGFGGIFAISQLNAVIRNNHILPDNDWAHVVPPDLPSSGGIILSTSFPTAPCVQRPRDTTNITIAGNDANNVNVYDPGASLTSGGDFAQYGVYLHEFSSESTDKLLNLSVTPDNSLFAGALDGQTKASVHLDQYVGLYGYSQSSVQPTNANLLLPPTSNLPRALPVAVMSASSTPSSFTPLVPVPPLCYDLFPNGSAPGMSGSTPLPLPVPPLVQRGSPRAVFKFSASDFGDGGFSGANNIFSISGYFSVKPDEDSGGGAGPSADPTLLGNGRCDFFYSGGTIWVADINLIPSSSSAVGPGGIDLLGPSGCVIHGATSSATIDQSQPAAYVLDLLVDVTLPVSPANKYHIYSTATDFQGRLASCPAGGCPPNYWGYWWNSQ